MGIKNLIAWLKKNHHSVLSQEHISKWEYTTIAVDGSIFMCKFKATAQEQWLESFISMVCWLRRANIHPIFVWDGSPPPEKNEEKMRRKILKKKQEDNINRLEAAIESYDAFRTPHRTPHRTPEAEAKAMTIPQKNLLQEVFAKEEKKMAPLLICPGGRPFSIDIVKDKLAKMKKNNFTIRPADYELLKKCLDVLKIPHVQAPGEAEKWCCQMVKDGIAEAVFSEDSDCMAYGVSTLLCKPLYNENKWTVIRHDELLEELQWTHSQFVDFCIMCGTDYNKNIRGIGPNKAYRLIDTSRKIEDLPMSPEQLSILKYSAARRLFTLKSNMVYQKPKTKRWWTSKPCMTQVASFIARHNLHSTTHQIENSFFRQFNTFCFN